MASKDGSPEVLYSGQVKRRLVVASSALAVVAVCLVIRTIGGRDPASAQAPGGGSAAVASDAPQATRGGNRVPAQNTGATSSKQTIVAVVNAEEIHREQLAQEALSQYGKAVLDGMKTKLMISAFAKQGGVTVSRQEVDEEITRMAKKWSIPPEQWMQMIRDERGIKPEQYYDIIWQTLVMRKMASNRIQPTEKEIEEAYQAQFGPAVRARLIVVDDKTLAKQVLAEAMRNPDEFGALARKHSVDPNSASLSGMIQPIRRNVGDPNLSNLEKAAFQMKAGEISDVIEVAGQYAILKSEGIVQTPGAPTREQVRGRLEELIRDKKLRSTAADLFKQFEDQSQEYNIYKNPDMKSKMPGVACSINGQNITVRQLAEECIERHGEEVLDVLIERKLLEQELKQRRITVNQPQLDSEISHAAMLAGKITKDGKPDREGWLKIVVNEQGVPLDKYIRDSVWPSAALKLLVNDKVKVTDEDIERGYKANYGAKAQVRAIVLDNQRRAQDVWQQARNNPSADFFGQLAEQYSMEPASKANAGRVPPIQQCGGQPELEKEAFSLQPGDISGVIQVQNKFVILFLERFTDPVKVSLAEVRSMIAEDVHEKKLRREMGKEFDRIKAGAHIDNFLAGTSHAPEKKMPGKPGLPAGAPQQMPASVQPGGPRQQPGGRNVPVGYEAAEPARPAGPPKPRSGSVPGR